MADHITTGAHGERLAAGYLTEKGFTILHTNWRHKNWEVDIIAYEKNVLHFIEVKTRRTKKFGNPEDDVSRKKIINLINAAEEFLYLHPEWKRIQFDIVSINMVLNKPPEIFFIEDVHVSSK